GCSGSTRERPRYRDSNVPPLPQSKQTTTKMNLQNLLTAFSWKHPENPLDHLSLISGRTPSLRTAFPIRDVARKPIQLLFAQSQHSNNEHSPCQIPGSGIACSITNTHQGPCQRSRGRLPMVVAAVSCSRGLTPFDAPVEHRQSNSRDLFKGCSLGFQSGHCPHPLNCNQEEAA